MNQIRVVRWNAKCFCGPTKINIIESKLFFSPLFLVNSMIWQKIRCNLSFVMKRKLVNIQATASNSFAIFLGIVVNVSTVAQVPYHLPHISSNRNNFVVFWFTCVK